MVMAKENLVVLLPVTNLLQLGRGRSHDVSMLESSLLTLS